MLNRIQISVVLLVVTGVVGLWIFLSNSTSTTDMAAIDTSSFQPPRDVVIDFYDAWLDVASSSPAGLPEFAFITNDLRSRIETDLAAAPAIDPILCSAQAFSSFGTKVIYTTDTNAEIVVSSRGLEVSAQAIVLLDVTPTSWVISDITCSTGEVGPEVEFTFEQTGNLLKDSLQAPRDTNRWHLVYTRNEVAGNVIPLYFDEGSLCKSNDAEIVVCSTDIFSEPQQVTVKGQMTEAGVKVQIVEL